MSEEQKPSEKGKATEAQVRYLLYLLQKNGYDTRYMDATYKRLGATMRERNGRVVDWLAGLTINRASQLIDELKVKARA
jgi:hypothetical protein